MKKVLLLGFLCGALSVLVFHQGTVALLHYQFPAIKAVTGLPDAFRPANGGYNLRAIPPLGVPQLLSTMFWGGLWGIALAALLRLPVPRLLVGFLFGAVICTLVGFTLVAGLRGQPMWARGDLLTWARVMLINGAWGWGTALLLQVMGRR